MLDAGETEIVSRDDLFSTETSHTPIVKDLKSVDWSAVLGYSLVETSEDPPSPDGSSFKSKGDDEPQEVEFSFFAPTSESNHVQKFVLPPTPPPELIPADNALEEVVVVHFEDKDIAKAYELHRPITYYLTPPLEDDLERAAKVEAAAVSGEDILKTSLTRWPGCELAWKVKHLVAKKFLQDSKKKEREKSLGAEAIEAIDIELLSKDGKRRRYRPNKKRRISIRRQRIEDEKKAVEEKKIIHVVKAKNQNRKKKVTTSQAAPAVHKRTEEEDRAKKTRMNRLKKVRKKQKMKEQPQGDDIKPE